MENFRLKVFRITAEQLSFRKAAELLHISQPAVSQQIHALEEEAGVRLFDRSKHIALTDAGTMLLRYAQKAARTMEEALEALSSLQGTVSGRLHLGASTTVAQYVLPRILGAFQRQYPQVQLSVISGNTEQVVEALAAGRIDLGLIEGPAMRRDVKTEKLLEDRMVLIVAPGHEWAEAGSIPVQALEQAQLLLREQGSGSRRVVELALKRAGIPAKRVHAALELDSTEAILCGVEAGLGVGFVSQWAIGKEVKLGTVVPVRIEGLQIRRDFSFIRAAGPEPAGTAGAFRKFALSAASQPQTAAATPPKRAISKANPA